MTEKDKREKTKSLKDNYEKIEKEGHRLQEQGTMIVKKAVSGKKQAEFLEEELPKYEKIAEQYPELSKRLNDDYRFIDLSIRNTNGVVSNLNSAVKIIEPVYHMLSTSVSTSGTAISAAISGVYRIEATHPEINFKEKYSLKDPSVFFKSSDTEELSKILNGFDSELESMRKGAWDVFYSNSESRLVQASHSMRDILRRFISKFATNDQVKRADWYKHEPDTNDGVSLKQRIRMLIYGTTKLDVDEEELKIIESQIIQFKDDYKYLSSSAHGSSKAEANSIEASMKSMEYLLLLILQRRQAELT